MTNTQKISYLEKKCEQFREIGTKLFCIEAKDFDAYVRLLGKDVQVDEHGCKYFLVKDVKVKRL